MAELEYEHPLNEKVRIFLRLDFLGKQLKSNLAGDFEHHCFYPLFELCDLTERSDYRMDVIKEMEKKTKLLVHYLQHPDTNKIRVNSIITRLEQYKENLQPLERPGAQLKQDRFLMAIKQRFNIPGACCSFDLPQLHFWLEQDKAARQAQYQTWQQHFQSLLEPVSLLLELTREPSQFAVETAQAGFYQGTDEHSLSIVRVKIDPACGCYPTISGHRNRYAIHFVSFDSQQHTENDIEFQLATCR